MIDDYILGEEHPEGIKKLPFMSLIWSPKWILSMRFLLLMLLGATLAKLHSGLIINISTLHYPALWIIALILFISNVAYILYYKYAILSLGDDKRTITKRLVVFIRVQIIVDLLLLTLILHFSGGATNPFVFFYIFHTTLSSILLTKRSALVVAMIAAGMFCTMTFLEGFSIINHYSLFQTELYRSGVFMVTMTAAVLSTLFILLYMVTSIVEKLRMYRMELEDTLVEVRRMEAEKSRFLNIVVHDLKNPIVAIESLVNSILTVHGDEFDPNIRKLLERIPVRTKDLVRFIKKLLEFSHIRKKKQTVLDGKILDLVPIVSSTLETYSTMIREKNLKVKVLKDDSVTQILGNKEYIGSMVGNLISNAIRYTLDNGSVTIGISSENGEVVLTVADTGIGIPEESLPQIFTDFFRAENAMKASTMGTGIGMSIIKSIVEEHDGTISVKSREGEGTTFTVRLPAAFDSSEPLNEVYS